ncbi:MAG: cell surface protein SprA [Candidatus Neomarinimicrobiota bacterium]
MKKIISFILFMSISFTNSPVSDIIFDPFKNKKKINYSLNNITNYPIGIFSFDKKYFNYELKVDREFSQIRIKQNFYNNSTSLPFISSFDDYIKQLYLANQQFNFSQPFMLSSSDTTASKKSGRFRKIAEIDLGTLGKASLRVQGNIQLTGKLVNQDQELVRSSFKEQEQRNFKFDQKQQLMVQGKVGDRITVSLDQNSERDFDWENTIRIDYRGDEDDILQKLELGNISLSLPSTEFVTFSGQNKGLFGVKALSKLGPINITSIASIEKTKKQSQKYKGNSELKINTIQDYEYRKNLYFFVHEWFRNGSNQTIEESGFTVNIPSYYPLEDGLHSIGNVVIRDFELYKIDASNNPKADIGVAHIDPNNTTFFSDKRKEGTFIRLNRGSDYTINEDLGFIRMKNTLQNEIIAAHYKIVDRTTGELIIQIGEDISDNNSSLSLKMIKAQSSHPNHPVWDLMFKNVYSMGATNIEPEGLEVQIIDNFSTPISDRTDNGRTFLNLFGLDNFNQTGGAVPDELVDYNNPNIINLVTGEIHLPALLPFVSNEQISGGNINSELLSFLQEGKMYTSSNRTEYTGDSRFTINANYTNPKSSINLGFTLVEGSEEIYSNGEKLKRGQDYQIDYFSGMIVLTGDIDPNSNLEISYDKHELVSFDRKIMAGSRAQIDFNEKSFLGLTALYYNQDIVNEKVEVGYEPIQNLIWDINGRYERDLENLSTKINQFNFFNANKISTFSIEGEIAQVLPNPNSISNSRTGDSNGVAFIDDFEGSKRVTNPSILKRFWNISSAPLNPISNEDYSQMNRMKMYWYNPYSQVLTNNIWPNVSTSQRAQNLTTDVLVLKYEPQDFQASIDSDSLWAGITTPMFIGDYDQTRSRFFEIWLRGDQGDLTIDLGSISEDYNGDGSLNTEDLAEAGFTLGNGFLEDNEDTGLDGCFSSYENGFGGCLDVNGSTYLQFLSSGETELINTSDDIDSNDPNGDDWDYIEGSLDYSKINGTEGNGSGERIQAGGKYPDTEDLDQSGFLDRNNDYFTKTISLNDSTYVEGFSEINGTKTGWKLVRIPLSHFDKIQDVTLSEIKYVRLVVSGVSESSQLEIAKMELVGNSWQELGTSILTEDAYAVQDSTFIVSVVNDEDNPDYIPPKGVFGEYDQVSDIRSKEQSLVLKFNNLDSNYKGAAKKILAMDQKKGQSFLMYDRMKMFIYGNSDFASSEETDLKFFIKFGNGDEYYKLTKPVYDTWDEELNRNEIDLDLNWLTSLKNKTIESIKLINPNDAFTDSINYKEYSFIDEFNEVYENIEIVGNPSLSRLQYFIVGIENESNHPITGEVWLDELRLSGVKKETGTAIRLKSKFNLSDLSEATVSYSRKDADFHVLQERIGTNQSVENFTFNNNIQLGNFFPSRLGITFPINMNYNMINNAPKFFPGTDIRTNDSAPDSILVKSSTISIGGRISKNIKSENPIIKYSIDNLSAGFNISSQNKSDVIMEQVDISRINTNVDYNLRFPSDNYIEAFKWTKNVPIIGPKLSETRFFYTPTTFSTGMKVNRNLTEKVARRNSDLVEDFTLGLDRRFVVNYKVFDNSQLSYNKNIRSDMSDYRDKVLSELKVGNLTSSTENFAYTFNPQWIEWFKPTFTYNSNYSWNKPLNSVVDAATINLSRNTGVNFSLSPTEVIEIFYTPAEKKQSNKSSTRSRSRGLKSLESEEQNQDKADNDSLTKKKKTLRSNLVIEKIYSESKKIDPLSISITNITNRKSNGINDQIPLAYRLGFNEDLELTSIPEVGFNTGNIDFKKSFTARTGVRFNPRTSVVFSFNESISSSINGYNIDIRSINRDYIAFGDYMSEGFPFSNWTIRIGGLEKIGLVRPYVSAISLEHAFSGKQNLSWKFNDESISGIKLLDISSFEDDFSDYLQFSRTTRSFSPLLGISTTFKNGISTNIRSNITHTLDEVANGLTYISDNSILTTISYNFSRGIRFTLPFTERKINLKNNFNITFNMDFSKKIEEGSKDKINFVEQNFSNTRKGVLRVSYALTNDISGSLFYEYRENDTRLTGKRIDRDFGVNLNIAIRGNE